MAAIIARARTAPRLSDWGPNGSRRYSEAPAWLARCSWPFWRLYRAADRRMRTERAVSVRVLVRNKGRRMTLTNAVALWSYPLGNAWRSRNPSWGSGGLQHSRTCDVSGLGHPGPCRRRGGV